MFSNLKIFQCTHLEIDNKLEFKANDAFSVNRILFSAAFLQQLCANGRNNTKLHSYSCNKYAMCFCK